ncbi:MAG: carbon-nitrogen hydrolase family protein [Rudaea sp.]
MGIRDRVLGTAVAALLGWKSRPGPIDAVIGRQRGPRAAVPSRDRVTAAAVQMEFNLLDGGAQYAEKVYALARAAVDRGAQLVVFPEYAWTPLLGMLPGIADLARRSSGGLESAVEELGTGAGLADIFRTVAPSVERAFRATGRAVSRALGIYLVSGSTISVDDSGRLYNIAYLFGPDGSLIGTQKKLHPFTNERDWLTCGSSLETFSLPFASLSVPVCMDFTYWETTRLAWHAGAEILVNPSADTDGDAEFLAARGVQTRVQECLAYGILSNLVTDLFGLHFRGPSRIVAPIGVDPRGATLARAATADREEIVVADLDLARLREFRELQAPEFNETLHRRYFPHAYDEYRRRVERDGKRLVV